ncbi:HlyC/CorC family transporter [Suttonella ornithocola]|uniref:Mg2+ and Co2+ transporter CorB n=1 Tax=Suttonella ornithocola TaxID=279832 RepID=A0A380MS42_9GAMM|nr:CNNM domain-containing protein [Suttonella ornithocola]SUO95459.1 Putative Mg2+ and Co2+ transporter CorB [Suttonella ornithocola]
MSELPDWLLVSVLVFCLACSAFFSASETAMMSLNRYKLKHLSDEGNLAAKRAESLLKNTERLLATILLGNNFVNILATSLGTIIGIRWFGDMGVLVATVVLTVLVLLFSEIAPKTFAALFPEKTALPASRVLSACLWLLSPLVWLLNKLVALIFKPFGLGANSSDRDVLTNEELKTIVLSSSPQSVSQERQDMLIGVLELEDVSVDEVMVPRNELEGVDLNDDWDELVEQITASRHGRLLAYRDNIDQVEGMLHLRDVITLYRDKRLNKEALIEVLRPCVFVPENTPLRQQLINFRQQKQRSGLVVDEYGDIQGLITLEDILTHIVGDIAEEGEEEAPEIVEKTPGIFDVNGGISLRVLNRELGLKLPLDGPNTLSGLIVEILGNFPKPGTEVSFDECIVRVKSFEGGVVEQAEVELLNSIEE